MEKKDIEIPFGAFDSELVGFEYTIPVGYEAEIKDGKVIVRKMESEDEKIRKEIRDFICWATDRGSITKEQIEKTNLWLSWLEKQGKEKTDDNTESTTQSYITPNQKFFQWIYDRLIYVHNENPDVDYMLSLKERIKDM